MKDHAATSYRLSYPIAHGSGTISEVQLRRPTVGDVMAVNQEGGSPPEIEIRMIARLAGLGAGLIEQMDIKDYHALQGMVSRMLTPPTAAGS
jgi:hypothetical protein